MADRLDELKAEVPVLFDEGDGIDFEAVAATAPQVILAAYSGLSRADYDTLSKIAPVVPYETAPWSTSWRDMIRLNAAGLGMVAEGDALQQLTLAVFADRLGGNERVLALPEGFMKQVTTDLDNVWVPTSTGIDVALDNN